MPRRDWFQRCCAFFLMLAGCATPQKQQAQALPPPPSTGGSNNAHSIPAHFPAPTGTTSRWMAYYDMKEPIERFRDLDLVVFDGIHYPQFSSLQPRTTVLGYLSVGEVHAHSPHLEELRLSGALIGRNADWGSFIVDPRSVAWRNHLLQQAIPAMIAAGFDGLMLDTADSPTVLVDTSAAEKQAMHAAMVLLVQDIRRQFPQMKLMLNRSFDLLPALATTLDYALAESTFSKFQAGKKPQIWEHAAQRPLVSMLRRAREKNPRLAIYTLDYWDMNDVEGVQFIYQVQRMRGFVPYVSSPDLRSTHAEPLMPAPENPSLRG